MKRSDKGKFADACNHVIRGVEDLCTAHVNERTDAERTAFELEALKETVTEQADDILQLQREFEALRKYVPMKGRPKGT